MSMARRPMPRPSPTEASRTARWPSRSVWWLAKPNSADASRRWPLREGRSSVGRARRARRIPPMVGRGPRPRRNQQKSFAIWPSRCYNACRCRQKAISSCRARADCSATFGRATPTVSLRRLTRLATANMWPSASTSTIRTASGPTARRGRSGTTGRVIRRPC